MAETINFDDGAAYEAYMGAWSQLAGDAFLDWLAPPPGQHWLDVGCGNGAFTETLVQRCSPASVVGVDPSPAQVAYARARPALSGARLMPGDAMALPLPDASVDIAVMPLVLFFVPEPAKGVAEMRRVVRPKGRVTAYSWDIPGGGFPYGLVRDELEALGVRVPKAPNEDAAREEVGRRLWAGAGLVDLQTRAIAVTRLYESFDRYWRIVAGGPGMKGAIAGLSDEARAGLRERVRAQLSIDAAGRVTCTARANAISGRVP